ncbi:WD40 repeat domain-containing protein, partial [Candidatus Dependentiae bacterium]|nr:WD40 repeat domain-containing protein [Candidatus Dependentiae bacterium]
NVVTGKRIRELKGFTGNLYAGAFSPNGETVIAGSSDGIAYLWDTKIGELVFQLEHIDPVYAVAFSPDGATVLTASINGRARLWDAKSGTALMVLYEYRDFVLRGTPEGVPVQPTRPCMLAGFSADGTLIFTSRYQESIVYIWDAHSGKLVRRLDLVDFGHDVYLKSYSGALSPQGNVLLTNMAFDSPKYAEEKHGAIIWDVTTGKQLHLLKAHTSPVLSVAYSPDGTTVLTGSEDTTACLWDSLTGNQLKVLDSSADVILVAFSKDGNSIFTLSSDNKMRIWKRSGAKVTSDVATRWSSAWNCFKEFYYLLLSEENSEELLSPKKAILSFTEAINLDDDSQKECSIQ